MIMGPVDWLKKYEDVELKAWQYFFDGGDLLKNHNKL